MSDDLLDPSPRAGSGRGTARRRRRLIVAAVVVGVLCLGGWWLLHRPPVRRAPSPIASAFGKWRLALVSSVGAEPSPPSIAGTSGAAAAIGVGAVCGAPAGARMDEAMDSVPDMVASAPTAADASAAAAVALAAGWPQPGPAERRILDALAQSSDASARAAALVLGPSGDPDDPPARLARLVDMAAHTSDPRVYALAFRACDGSVDSSRPPACSALNTAQWARLDSGNGLPWLYALATAARQGDAAARDDALFHLAAAERVDDRWADLGAAVADRTTPDDEATLAGWNLVGRAVYAIAPPPLQTLIVQCNAARVAGANRRQLCAAVADKLIDRGSSLILQSIGGSVDRLATGNAERADRLLDERNALLQDTRLTDFSCISLRRNVHRLRRAAQVGELAALREAAMMVTVSPAR